jgi:hypothetical protein
LIKPRSAQRDQRGHFLHGDDTFRGNMVSHCTHFLHKSDGIWTHIGQVSPAFQPCHRTHGGGGFGMKLVSHCTDFLHKSDGISTQFRQVSSAF